MQIQSNLGSDIAMAFDEWKPGGVPKLFLLPDTVNCQMLFGINQGATFRAAHLAHEGNRQD